MGKWGFIGRSGEFLINPKFDYANSFSDGLAKVRISGKWGFVDESGEVVIDPQFDNAGNFSEGLAAVESEEKWSFVDKAGKTVVSGPYDDAYSFRDGVAMVIVNEKYGFIDRLGHYVASPSFESADEFSEGLALVSKYDADVGFAGSYFIDVNGQRAIDRLFGAFTSYFSEGLAVAFSIWTWPQSPLDVESGFIDKAGSFVLRYTDAASYSAFSSGLARFLSKKNNKHGFLSKEGDVSIAPRFEDADRFHDELCRVVLAGKIGFINNSGKFVIPNSFDGDVGSFSEGFARVRLIDKTGYIDKSGEWAIRPRFVSAFDFSHGLAAVEL